MERRNVYDIIEEVLKNLKKYKELPYVPKEKKAEEKDDQDNGYDEKTWHKLEKIQRKMRQISSKIEELENEEVDWDSADEENSAYCLVDR